MLRVALTGGLGSGKSTVAGFFRDLGARVMEADTVARDLMQPGQAVYRAVVDAFGEGVVQADGTLDRKRLASLAFEHGRIEELNRIIHPPVIAAALEWMDAVGESDEDAVAIYESAILFETDRGTIVPGWRRRFDRIVLVTAPEKLRIARFLERAGNAQLTPLEQQALIADVHNRLRRQLPDEEKIPLADYILQNGTSLEEARRRTNAIYAELCDLARMRPPPPATHAPNTFTATASKKHPGESSLPS
jgi:dephospho-CoA kinase